MSRIELLKGKIQKLYQAKHAARDEWADWMWDKHVAVVADYAENLAERYGVNADLAVAGALLHDIADAIMGRRNPAHESESGRMARELLQECGFTQDEIRIVVDDAIRFHSCHGDEKPESLEGKVLATADALAHLKTDFYEFGIRTMKERGESREKISQWIAEKAERDFYKKIAFEQVREEARADYGRIKGLLQEL